MQNIYNDSGITQMALSKIKINEAKHTVNEAIELLISMLNFSNKNVQRTILGLLKKHTQFTEDIFKYLKIVFHDSLAEILSSQQIDLKVQGIEVKHEPFMKRKQDLSIQEFVVDILKFIQLLNDNCYDDFQNFLRFQGNTKIMVSTNIVNEISNFVVQLCEKED